VAIPIFTVDAFADEPFSGNPAGVCLLDQPADAEWMQRVAGEMNLSETAFVSPRADGFDLRWFTPTIEMKLCGHATLASAHVLWETGTLGARAAARFHTLSGELVCERKAGAIEMNFPAKPVTATTAPAGLIEALGVTAKHVAKNEMDYLVEVGSEAEVRELLPDFGRLAAVEARGVMVTSRASSSAESGAEKPDFVSRFFAPRAGVAEDPVTGSAHCALGPYWHAKLDKNPLVGRQLSARGGTVTVGIDGDRVTLAGTAVTVLKGVLLQPVSV
jgi:PhzF family phenazine biosynthesis protein